MNGGSYGGISQSGSSGSYSYSLIVGRESWPVNYVSWYDCLRFANWLHNGQPTGIQNDSTTEDGAYTLTGATSLAIGDHPIHGANGRNVDAKVWLPSEDEWYKAAYYKGGGTSAGYWDYPTQSNTAPTAEGPPGTDLVNGSANYDNAVGTVTEVGAYTSKPSNSAYDTFDQAGNVWEWNEAEIVIGSQRGLRGGSYGLNLGYLRSAYRNKDNTYLESTSVGFRVAANIRPVVTSPNGGEELIAGQTETITWDSAGDINYVSIDYSSNNGNTWIEEDPNTPNDGEYDWTVPQVTSNQCLVRVSDASDPNVYDTSDDVFTIYVCQIEGLWADRNNDCKVSLPDFALFALEWLRCGNPFDDCYTEPLPIMWVYIDDPGVPTHEAFNGYMSKYETTNAQYCQFLNSAKADELISVYNNVVYAASDTAHSEPYFDTYAATSHSQITYSGGVFTVRSRNGYDMSNHPVVVVSWYGATAFCNYHGYRLPTEWEWQAVADFDGSYIYGCGINIDHTKANYYSYNPLGLTTTPYTSPVNYYDAYGYGICDMAGNVLEWTSSNYSNASNRALRGGGWNHDDNYCEITNRDSNNPYDTWFSDGFRVVKDIE